jgi:hypothetical protein
MPFIWGRYTVFAIRAGLLGGVRNAGFYSAALPCRKRPRTATPVRNRRYMGSSAPPPDLAAGAAGTAFSTAFADALADSPLTEDVHLSVNVRVNDGVAGA